jgi:hypothetical protein
MPQKHLTRVRRIAAMTDNEEREAVVQILKLARAYITLGWSQHAAAIDKEGDKTTVLADDAVAWCAYSAIFRAGNNLGLTKYTHTAVRHVANYVRLIPTSVLLSDLGNIDILISYNDSIAESADNIISLLLRTEKGLTSSQ